MANTWLRLYAEFATDPKMQMMSEAYQRRFIMLLCLRCCNVSVTLHETEVAFQLRISDAEWAETKAEFLAKNLITEDNRPTAWDKRQFVSDSSAARVAAHRERKKTAGNVTVTLQKRKCNAVDTDTDTDTDTDKVNNKDIRTAETQPTIKKRIKRESGAEAFDPLRFLIDNGTDHQTASDYLELRRSKKAVATHTALNAIASEARKAGMTLQAALVTCCARSWVGFKADWITGDPWPPGSARSGPSQRPEKFDPVAYVNRNRTKHNDHSADIIDITPERMA